VTGAKGDPASLLHDKRLDGLKVQDRDLATELVYGVLRWQNRLDYILEAFSSRPVERVDLPILLALRMGLYQIRFLTRVPERAAVDEAVKLSHIFGPRGTTGFVNAVLRAACRQSDQPALPNKDNEPLRYLTVTLSHPEWLARRYLDNLGLDRAEARCCYHNQIPPQDVRIEPPGEPDQIRLELANEGVESRIFPLVPGSLRIVSGQAGGTSLYKAGRLFIQEAGSQLIPFMLGPRAGNDVLDACAAPGSKATQMSRWCAPGSVIAIERRPRRLKLLADVSKRLGTRNLRPLGADAMQLPFRKKFKYILLDAPCSSLGTLARNPDIKWKLRESDFEALSQKQFQLLQSCSMALEQGGRLVYATCSTEPEENEALIGRFISEQPEFRIASPPQSFPAEAKKLLDADGTLRICPERDEMDGYYAVALER
jgi:16S rRNA (cytosine967-C5)-methyltransferase